MERERHYFVWFIGALLLSATGYFGYTTWDSMIKPKVADGEKVYASVTGYDYKNSELQEDLEELNDSNYYQAWRNAVLSNYPDLNKEDAELVKNYTYQLKSQAMAASPDHYEETLKTTLAESGTTDPEEFAVNKMKSQRITGDYVKEHISDYEDKLRELKPRKVSLLVLSNITEAEEGINKEAEEALKTKSFEEVIDEYDLLEGRYKDIGYMDKTILEQMGWDQPVVDGILAMDKEGVSDWITVEVGDTEGMTKEKSTFDMCKVKIKITDLGYEKNTEEADMYCNAVTDTNEIEKIIWEYSKKLEISYADPKTEERINNYRKKTYGIGDEEEKAEDTADEHEHE